MQTNKTTTAAVFRDLKSLHYSYSLSH